MLNSLSDRERYMVIACAVFVLIAVIWRFAPSDSADIEARRLESAKTNLARMVEIANENAELKRTTAGFDRVTKPEGEFDLIPHVTAVAEKHGATKISSKPPRTTPLDDRYTERLVEISLDDITLPQLVAMLHDFEYAEDALNVRRMRIRPKSKDPNVMDVTLSLATYTVSGG